MQSVIEFYDKYQFRKKNTGKNFDYRILITKSEILNVETSRL